MLIYNVARVTKGCRLARHLYFVKQLRHTSVKTSILEVPV